jgi:hypothetical protein
MRSREGMLLHCSPRTSDLTEEEYRLCMRQFAGMENLICIMVENGRLPAWVAGRGGAESGIDCHEHTKRA